MFVTKNKMKMKTVS